MFLVSTEDHLGEFGGEVDSLPAALGKVLQLTKAAIARAHYMEPGDEEDRIIIHLYVDYRAAEAYPTEESVVAALRAFMKPKEAR